CLSHLSTRCYSSLSRRVLWPTRFAYTTLFRSAGDAWLQSEIMSGVTADVQAAVSANPHQWLSVRSIADQYCDRAHTEPLVRIGADRKSTRLNSSHQIISYAVFCLKKNEKNNCA